MSDTRETWKQLDMGLDTRLVKAMIKIGIVSPTKVQKESIPFALQGKDVLSKFYLYKYFYLS